MAKTTQRIVTEKWVFTSWNPFCERAAKERKKLKYKSFGKFHCPKILIVKAKAGEQL